MSLCFWVHNIPKFKASSLEETIGFFSFIFSSLKDNFFFKISLSTLNFNLFCGNFNGTALSFIAFPEKEIRRYNENDFSIPAR